MLLPDHIPVVRKVVRQLIRFNEAETGSLKVGRTLVKLQACIH
jgi:hypothetical protein